MSELSKISYVKAVEIAKKLKKQGGVGAKIVNLSNREDSLNRANDKSQILLQAFQK